MVNGLSPVSMDSSAQGVCTGKVSSHLQAGGQGCSLGVGVGMLSGDGGSRLFQCPARATGWPEVCSEGWGPKDHQEAARHLCPCYPQDILQGTLQYQAIPVFI